MRFLVPALVVCSVLLASGARAEPPAAGSVRQLAAQEAERLRLGAPLHWTSEALGRHVGFGLGFALPQRWYDTDGELLTERSLLHPGGDLERSGLYLALRF